MNKNSFFAVLAVVFVGLILTSCNKSNRNYDTSFSEDYTYAENTFKDIADIGDEGYEKGSTGHKSGDGAGLILSDCADVSIDFSSDPYELVIDFGEENCLCNDDKYRRGKIIVTFDGAYREEGTTITHTLENYFVDDDMVEGTKTVINQGRNENEHFQFDIDESGIITKNNDGGTITWNSERQREWIEGDSTLKIRDDVYLITGIANGTTTTNESWDMEIIKPLQVELDCRWVPSGSIEINIQDIPTALLDYGDGNCDRVATIEIDGKTYTIYMK